MLTNVSAVLGITPQIHLGYFQLWSLLAVPGIHFSAEVDVSFSTGRFRCRLSLLSSVTTLHDLRLPACGRDRSAQPSSCNNGFFPVFWNSLTECWPSLRGTENYHVMPAKDMLWSYCVVLRLLYSTIYRLIQLNTTPIAFHYLQLPSKRATIGEQA